MKYLTPKIRIKLGKQMIIYNKKATNASQNKNSANQIRKKYVNIV